MALYVQHLPRNCCKIRKYLYNVRIVGLLIVMWIIFNERYYTQRFLYNLNCSKYMYTTNLHVLILPRAGQPGCPCVGYLCGVLGPAPSFGGTCSIVNARPVHKLRLTHDFKHCFLQPRQPCRRPCIKGSDRTGCLANAQPTNYVPECYTFLGITYCVPEV